MVILIGFIALMYFLLIRPQKKKEKSVNEMRNALRVGDEIVTIGGICGKIVKTKDETLIIQVGADKTKFEVMRWSVSSVVNKNKKAQDTASSGKGSAEKQDREEEPRRKGPRRLKKAEPEEKQEEEKKAAPQPKKLKKEETAEQKPAEAAEEVKAEDAAADAEAEK